MPPWACPPPACACTCGTAAAEWLATTEVFEADDSALAHVNFVRETCPVLSPLSFCKGPQAWLYVRAAHEQQRRGRRGILLCNAAGHMAEADAVAVF